MNKKNGLLVVILAVGFITGFFVAFQLKNKLPQISSPTSSVVSGTTSASYININDAQAERNNVAYSAWLSNPNVLLASPKNPPEGRPFFLKAHELAAVKFACGFGENVTHWTENIRVKSIEKLPGDLLQYKANLELSNGSDSRDYEILPDTFLIEHDSSIKLYILRVDDDKINLIATRNAC